ncbi:MAG: FHA domain-containing protein [Planctomycetes bacterium]|nr:FHA domain-containing protein [Planctomycetota bacterium]MBU1517357.1 FHA domain-containing protein [Planctomycetota bacterium]MBU2457684.1 FHA domain-containing protein [Planctomycetota bacterium]MBU2596021.1 FHA domain-containing protein [Planctomycetota bacterium]
MRLTVKQGDRLINELHFSRGPIYVGRQVGSQIFLPDKAVSRQHTVLYTTTEGKWVVEDLDSANKTYLNDEAIHKSEIKNGDILKISDFHIEIQIDEAAKQGAGVTLEDTLHATLHEAQIVLRHLDGVDAPLIKMQAKRGKDFAQAASAICKSLDAQELLITLLDLVFRQFKPFHAWVGLRRSPSGSMEVSKGKEISGKGVNFEELVLRQRVNEVLENHRYILVPRLPLQMEKENKVNSAMIVPVMSENKCFGVIYADNSLDHEHYGMNDLDYLILISLMAGAFIKNL